MRFFALPRSTIVDVLRTLAGIAHVTIEDRAAVLTAIDALESGMDFVDALHIVRSANATSFATFDRQLARQAQGSGFAIPVELLT